MPALTVRPVAPSDAARLAEIYAPYVTDTAISFEAVPPDAQEFARRIGKTLQTYPYLVAEQDGVILGYCYAGSFVGRAAYNWAAELSIYLDREYRGRGAGRLLYEEMERLLRAMHITNLYACIGHTDRPDSHLDNNSEQFHAHMGFTTVGVFKNCGRKFDTWYDMIWMEKIIAPHTDAVKPMIPYPLLAN